MSSHGKSLYDQFLMTLPSTDEETSRFSCIKDIFDRKITSPDTSEYPVASVAGKSDSSPTETKEFLKKIYEPVDLAKVHGFDYDKMSMKMLLLNDDKMSMKMLLQNDKIQASDINLVGIFGMLGVGKTTLGRLICNEEEVKQRFVPRISISMHEAESMEEVVKNMLQHLEVDEKTIGLISEKHKLPGLLYALYLQLKGKRYLILLDDVRDKANYYEGLISCLKQGHGFPKGCGGAVILTSRNEEAIKTVVEEKKLHHLLPLSDPNSCWQIYQNLASVEDDALDPTVKDELKKKCGGLPLAARILGEWKSREKKSQNEDSNKESKSGNEDGSKAPTVSEEDAKQGSKNSGDGGSKETFPTPKDGAKEAPTVSEEDAKEGSTNSGDGGFKETPPTPKDGAKEAPTVSKEDAKQGSTNSGDGSSKETSTTPKDGAKEASEAPKDDDASQAPTE